MDHDQRTMAKVHQLGPALMFSDVAATVGHRIHRIRRRARTLPIVVYEAGHVVYEGSVDDSYTAYIPPGHIRQLPFEILSHPGWWLRNICPRTCGRA